MSLRSATLQRASLAWRVCMAYVRLIYRPRQKTLAEASRYKKYFIIRLLAGNQSDCDDYWTISAFSPCPRKSFASATKGPAGTMLATRSQPVSFQDHLYSNCPSSAKPT